MQQGGFLPESAFSADSRSQLSVLTLARCPYTAVCAIACIYFCAHVKDPIVHVRASLVDYGDKKTPSMPARLGSATLSPLVFPGEGNPNFPWEKSHRDNAVVKSKSKKIEIKRIVCLFVIFCHH